MSTHATSGSTPTDAIAPLRRFVAGMTELVGQTRIESEIFARGTDLMAELIRDDAWLPDAFAQPHPDRYCQYLLHCDPLERFSVVSFVWGPGQSTPIHDHMVWGIVGVIVLRKTRPDLHRPFVTPFGIVLPVLGALFCAALMFFLPAMTWVRFAIWLVIGFVVYFLYSIRHSRLERTPA